MNARPEQVTVTDPAPPLHGRVFSLVSLPSAPGPGSCAQVAYRGDIVLKIPVEATSLRPAAPGMPASKLTLHAIRELVRVAARGEPADPGAPDRSGPRADAAPRPSPPPTGGGARGAELVAARHLGRKAVIYVRQSSPHQVLTNQESLRLQYALRQRARELGWQEASIEVIDADLGLSGAAAAHRQGFKELIARVTLGEVGLVLSSEVTRLARNCSDWYPLLDLCGYRACLIADRDGVYDPSCLCPHRSV